MSQQSRYTVVMPFKWENEVACYPVLDPDLPSIHKEVAKKQQKKTNPG